MNKHSSRLLKLEFLEQLKKLVPAASKVTGPDISSSVMVYDLRSETIAKFFLVLVLSEKRDEFTIELRWSTVGNYPAYAMLESPANSLECDPGVIRITELWISTTLDFWWKVPLERTLAEHRTDSAPGEETLARMKSTVQSQVADAMAKISQHVIPFMKKVADSLGKPKRR